MTRSNLRIRPDGRSIITYESSSIEIFMNSEDRSGRLSELYSVNRGQGYATKLMTLVCEWADENDVYLWLVARPYGNPRGALEMKDLIKFYERFDFRRADRFSRKGYSMERSPQSMS